MFARLARYLRWYLVAPPVLVIAASASASAQQHVHGVVTENDTKKSILTLAQPSGAALTLEYTAVTRVLVKGIAMAGSGIAKGTTIDADYMPTSNGPANGIAQSVYIGGAPSQIWRNEFIFGVEFAKDASDGQSSDFSAQTAVLAYRSDTMWARWGPTTFHSFLIAGLHSIPNQEATTTESMDGQVKTRSVSAAAADGDSLKTFLASRKSLTLDIGFHYDIEVTKVGDDVLTFGPAAEFGLSSITDTEAKRPDSEPINDTVKSFWAAGGRFSHHERVSDETNPEILRSVDVLIGKFENFELEGTNARQTRVLIRAWLRIPGSVPFFMGFVGNLGDGKDDLRIIGALQFDVNKLFGVVP